MRIIGPICKIQQQGEGKDSGASRCYTMEFMQSSDFENHLSGLVYVPVPFIPALGHVKK